MRSVSWSRRLASTVTLEQSTSTLVCGGTDGSSKSRSVSRSVAESTRTSTLASSESVSFVTLRLCIGRRSAWMFE